MLEDNFYAKNKMIKSPKRIKNYADQVYHFESLLEFQYQFQTIQELANLYKNGIQCYAIRQPKKSNYFRKKLINLIGEEKFQGLLNLNNSQNSHRRTLSLQSQKQFRSKASTSRTDCSEQFQYQNNTSNSKQFLNVQIRQEIQRFRLEVDNVVKDLVRVYEDNDKRKIQLEQLDIQKQRKQLQERIKNKKIRRQSTTLIQSQQIQSQQ